jgi:VPDSG-CTERM motif
MGWIEQKSLIMKNLKVILSGAAMVFSTVAAQATANSVVLTQNAYSFSCAGEFNANTSYSFLGNYAPSAIVGTGFETFCIETMVDFNPGQTYTYTLGSVDSRGVALTEGAAYLYKEFGDGILPGYNYTDTATRNTDASYLQAAIWWFQGEQTFAGYPSPTNNNVFYTEAINALGGLANADAPEDGRFEVDVLQMWDGSTPAQNQLVLVPDNGATAGLFAMGLAALAVARRRLIAA